MLRGMLTQLFTREIRAQAEGAQPSVVARVLRIPRVQVAHSLEQRRRIYQFRYQIYVADMGKRPANADHMAREISDALDDEAVHLFIEDDGEITAVMRCNFRMPGGVDAPLAAAFGLAGLAAGWSLEQMAFTSSTMTVPSVRKKLHMAALYSYVYTLGRMRGMRSDTILCAPGLVPYFARLGYRRYKENVVLNDIGLRVPMTLVLDSVQFLREANSPLQYLAPYYADCDELPLWLTRQYPLYAQHGADRGLPARAFWQEVNRRMCGYELDLFAGFTEQELHDTLRSKATLHCPQGTKIMRSGDTGRELFAVVSGVVELSASRGSNTTPLAVIGPGESFGETEFLREQTRRVDAVALTDVELLVVSQGYLNGLREKHPRVASKLLYNLALMLSDRLHGQALHH